jgi:hypothetical protein
VAETLRAFKIVKGRGRFSHKGTTYNLGDTVVTSSDLLKTGFGERFEEVELPANAPKPEPETPVDETVDVPSAVKKLLPAGSSVVSRAGKVVLKSADGKEQEFDSIDAMANALV